MLITGYRADTDQLVAQLVAEGADAVHYKPFQIPELIDTLGKLARTRGGSREETASMSFGRSARRLPISW